MKPSGIIEVIIILTAVFIIPLKGYCLCTPLSLDNNNVIRPVYTCMSNFDQIQSQGGVLPITFSMNQITKDKIKEHFNLDFSRAGMFSGISNVSTTGNIWGLIAADVSYGAVITATDSCPDLSQSSSKEFTLQARYAKDLLGFVGIPNNMTALTKQSIPVTIINNGYCLIPAKTKLSYQFVKAGSTYNADNFKEAAIFTKDLAHNGSTTVYIDFDTPKVGLYVLNWSLSYDTNSPYPEIISNQVYVTDVFKSNFDKLYRVCQIVGCNGINNKFEEFVNPSDRFNTAIHKSNSLSNKLHKIKTLALQLVNQASKTSQKNVTKIEVEANNLLTQLKKLGF